MEQAKAFKWAHPVRVAACAPEFMEGFRRFLGPQGFEELGRAMQDSSLLTSQVVERLTQEGRNPRLKQFIQATSHMEAGTEMGNSYAALLYVRQALSPQPYFLLSDALVEMLEHTDLSDDVPVSSLRLPYPRFYLEMGVSRSVDAYVPNIQTGMHRLEGMYCETGTHPDFGEGLYVMLTGSPMGKSGPLDDATNSIFLPTLEPTASLPQALQKSFENSTRLSQAAGLRQSPREFMEHSLHCLNLLAKALLYISMPEAKRTNKQELSKALEELSRKKSSAKQAKARRALAGMRDYILIEAPIPDTEPGAGDFVDRKGPRAHWRRGHYRMQVHGEGRQQRKLVFIQPQLIAVQALSESVAAPKYVVR